MPVYSAGCIHKAIKEIISLVKLTTTKNVEIVLGNKIQKREFLFDKQRLQQVVLNLLSNAIKF